MPLPPVDAVHLAMLAYEESRAPGQSPRREWVTQGGFVLVILLMATCCAGSDGCSGSTPGGF